MADWDDKDEFWNGVHRKEALWRTRTPGHRNHARRLAAGSHLRGLSTVLPAPRV